MIIMHVQQGLNIPEESQITLNASLLAEGVVPHAVFFLNKTHRPDADSAEYQPDAYRIKNRKVYSLSLNSS